MKKILSVVLCLALLLSFGIFASAAAYTPGTYTGVGYGHNGRIEVEVTFSEDAITDVNIVSHSETAGICEVAMEQIPTLVVDNQSLGIDAITSATDSSHGIMQAIEDCVAQAGGDVEALKAVKIEKEDKSTVFESIDADICVIGGGVSGSVAAIQASDLGAKVVLLEKAASTAGEGRFDRRARRRFLLRGQPPGPGSRL